MRGRKPDPVPLKLVKGNPGRRPLPEDAPVPASADAPARPAWLDGEAAAEWDRVVSELAELGLLTELDRAMLSVYCQAWADVVRLKREISEEGEIVETMRGGPKRNPKAVSLREAYERLRSAASEFGMTPVARSRVGTGTKTSDEDPLAELERRRKAR